MDENLAVSVKDTTKIYNLYQKPIDRLKEILLPGRCYHTEHYALNHISFDVKRGEFLGIIGTNGSGKSTILKIITGVLTPTKGTVETKGRISALLELGAGFNMEYTGMENLYMNGSMMGYSRQEMEAKIPEILEFADIGDYVNQPVKSYSSGMFVRLAFALAISVEPDILIVDEALAVGDVFFQTKCYQRINEIRERGATVILVTHSMGSIIKYCDRVVLLNKGNVISVGEPAEMVDLFKKILTSKEESQDMETKLEKEQDEASGQEKKTAMEGHWKDALANNPDYLEYGDGKAEIIDFALLDDKNQITNTIMKNAEFTIRMKVRFFDRIENPIFAYTIKDKQGTELSGTNTLVEKCSVPDGEKGKEVVVSFTQNAVFQGGEYLISLGCTGFCKGEFQVHQRLYDVTMLSVLSEKDGVGFFDLNSRISIQA